MEQQAKNETHAKRNTTKRQLRPEEWQIHGLHQTYLQHPLHTALRYQDKTISYGELEQQIQAFACYMLQQGLLPGERVALAMPNCPAFIYAYLGITRAGGTVLPLHLLQAPQELLYILGDAKARFLVTTADLAAKFQENGSLSLELIVLDSPLGLGEEALSLLKEKPISFPLQTQDSIATFLYTSGTTGRPKAAMLSHANLIADVIAMDHASDFDREDNFLAVLPMFHSFGWTVCVLLPLYLGCSITILDGFRPKEMLQVLTQPQGVTVFCGVPSMFHVISKFPQQVTFPSLKFAISGGDSLSGEIMRIFEEQYRFPILEGYGLSEASPVVCINPLYGTRKLKSIGLPLPGLQVAVVDTQGQKLPPGEIGELIVQGGNVMQGYYNRPEETAAVLRDHWLHTGDLAYQDEDGYFYIAGRSKELIITAGFNVYPQEVEEALTLHPAIQEAAVIGIPHPGKGQIGKAYVVLAEGCQVPSKKEMTLFLRDKLASYKIPEEYVFTSDLPRGASGKILKRKLQ